MTQRIKDKNGFMELKGNNIARSGMLEYYGHEIGAPEPDKLYKVYRPREALDNPETLDSFKLVPFIINHTHLGDDGAETDDMQISGVTGEDVFYDHPYIKANLKIFGNEAQENINDDFEELSIGFTSKYVFNAGETAEGEYYDALQLDITGNHLALVEEGRAGSEVKVADGKIVSFDSMGTKRKGSDSMNEAEKILEALAALHERVDLMGQEIAAIKGGDMEESEDMESEDMESEDEESEDMESGDEEHEGGDMESEDEESEDMESGDEEGEDEESKDMESGDSKRILALEKKIAKFQKSADARNRAIAKKQKNELYDSAAPFIVGFDHSKMTKIQVAKKIANQLGLEIQGGDSVSSVKAAIQIMNRNKTTYRQVGDSSGAVDIHKIFGGE